MNLNVIAILIICLILLILIYVLGIEVGKASILITHPGYSPQD